MKRKAKKPVKSAKRRYTIVYIYNVWGTHNTGIERVITDDIYAHIRYMRECGNYPKYVFEGNLEMVVSY